jgi:hypothetical protein
VTKIADMTAEWDVPSHDWGDKTGWRLFYAATYVLTGKVADQPNVTTRMHRIIDAVCEPFAEAA